MPANACNVWILLFAVFYPEETIMKIQDRLTKRNKTEGILRDKDTDLNATPAESNLGHYENCSYRFLL